MIVYLLVHLPTEMSYVGSTETSVERRFERHWDARKKESTELAEALRLSDKRDWLRVELERYDTLEAMLNGEREWILELETQRPGVGYNSQVPRKGDIDARLGRRAPIVRSAPAQLDADYFGSCARGYWDVDHEEERARRRREASERTRTWWTSLTPEQQQAHKQRGREAGRDNGPRKVKGG